MVENSKITSIVLLKEYNVQEVADIDDKDAIVNQNKVSGFNFMFFN